jgi:hypothetical protein
MTGVVLVSPKNQFFDSSGAPLTGGTVTTYLAGTTTLATTYQDKALTTANTNPITLNARGECSIWGDSGSNYKWLVKDSTGATLYTEDNIPGAADTGAAATAAAAAAAVHATAAQTAETNAETAEANAEAARDSLLAAASIYADTTAGLAATANGGYFWVPATAADEAYILYKDNAGVAEEVKRIASFTASVGLHERNEARSGDFKWIGRETPIDGAGTAMVQGNWILDTPATAAGYLKTFRVWAEATGTLKLRTFTKSGDDFTEVRQASITVGSTGLQEFTAEDFGIFPIASGEYLGLYTAGGLVSRTSIAAPLASSYRLQAGAEDATVTAATVFQNAIYEFGFEIPTEYLTEPVARFEAVEALASALDVAAMTAQTIGVTTPAAGTNAGIATYVIGDPATNTGYVKEVIAYSAVADRLTFSVYGKVGLDFTQTGEQVTVDVAIGSNTIPLNLPITAGQYLGVTIVTAGGITYNAGSNSYYFGTLAGGTFTGTLSAADLQVRFNLRVSSDTASTGLWLSKRLAFFGDSITDEGSSATWAASLCTYLGATKALNDARSGTMMYDALDNTISTTFNNVDAAVVFYGTNDYGNNTTLGAVGNAAGSGTFYAQIKLIIETWLGWKPTLKIIFVTPLQRTAAPAVSAGQTLLQYVNAIKEVAALYACPVLDLHLQSGLNAINASTLTSDGLHPTAGAQTTHIANPAKAFFNATSP